MYDLRGNPGGDVEFADNMVQLFKPDFEPFGDRYLMNPITQNIFVNKKDPNVDPYAKPGKRPRPGKRLSQTVASAVFFSPTRWSLQTPLVRPMSALWESSMMQGATLPVKYSPVESRDTVPEPYLEKMFPFSQELTSGPKTYANTLTVGVTQTVRTGLYNGQDIEDAGIKTDTVVRPQWSDLQFGSPTNTQYDRIAESLARTGQENGQSKLHFVCEPFSIEKPINGFLLEVEAAVSADAITLGNSPIIIVGKTAGEQVLKTKRNVRIIPSDENHMKISTREFIFEGTSDSVGLYQSPTTAPADGWNNLKGPWMIGNGIQYAKNIDSSIEAFFSAPIGTKINIGIDVTLDSALGHDFLYLSVKSSDSVDDLITSPKSRYTTEMRNGISGWSMVVKETFPFITKSEQFSVALRFTSDGIVEFTGATIKLFTVSAA
ncbi:hypothetical protein BASA60_004766 [Batrachochytrium salamandrivorans]|nr:hypothetical protein BASA60_004766 [Batrachochytrium salamandrivorans]